MAQAINSRFDVTPGKRVTLRIDIGNGQIASSIINIPGRQPTRRRDSFELDLGEGESLRGKKVICSTIVTDVMPSTNRTSLRARVDDGVTSVDESRNEEAEENGVVTYATVLRFR